VYLVVGQVIKRPRWQRLGTHAFSVSGGSYAGSQRTLIQAARAAFALLRPLRAGRSSACAST